MSVLSLDNTGKTDAYRLAEEFSERTGRCLFITGKAGTGKTTFLRHLREESKKNMAVVAPTGVAAINAGGVTIHSFFQLPVRTLVPTPQSYRQMFAEQRMMQRKRNMLYHLEMLVIDEISMVRADVLDAIDAVLRRYKYRQNQPFGGVQVVMIGDLFQLSPVVTKGDDAEALGKYYDGPYFFHAKVMQQLQPVYIEFDRVFRQQNGQFVSLLNEVRENRLTAEGRAMLNARYLPDFRNKEDDFHITLTTHNHSADAINERELAGIKGTACTFKADVTGEFPENNFPADETLVLKTGARVMFIRNDDQKPKRFYNGKTGVVTGITDESVTVCCEDGVIEAERMEWKNIRYREDERTGRITEEVLGTFTQFPLRLAWAVTIHKSQGLTFDRVIIDAARAFAAGQVYVALSRCRTLEGIVLSTPLQHVALANDPGVIRYTQAQPALETVSQFLPQAQTEYELQLFSGLFDFRRMASLVEQMRTLVGKAVSFNADTIPFLEDMDRRISAMQPVSEKFQAQLTRIILNTERTASDTDYLRSRLKAAAGYFLPLLGGMADAVAVHPCRSRNKSDAADFETLFGDFFLVLHQKIHLMHSMEKEAAPSADTLLEARNTFAAPESGLRPVMEKPVRKTAKKKTAGSRKSEVVREPDDAALDTMIHDFLVEGKPSSFLLEFVRMLRQKKQKK